MNFSDAVALVLEDLGNRTGSGITARVKRRFAPAQRDLESGKTLPKFLLVEDEALVLTSASSALPLPSGFIRFETPPHFIPVDSDKPVFVKPKTDYQAAFEANVGSDAATPQVFCIRQSTIDFINRPSQTVNMVWSYYKRAAALSADGDTNAWLNDLSGGADWLIGEVGWRSAMGARDADAITIFDKLRTAGRAACLGEIIAAEESTGPLVMGANL